MYRCAVYPQSGHATPQGNQKLASAIRGVFSIASDSVAMGCVEMCNMEGYFAKFAVKLMGVVNQVISAKAAGRYHVQCILENLLVQNLISGMSDSAYGYHDDGGPELCHKMFDYLGLNEKDWDVLLEVLSLKLM